MELTTTEEQELIQLVKALPPGQGKAVYKMTKRTLELLRSRLDPPN